MLKTKLVKNSEMASISSLKVHPPLGDNAYLIYYASLPQLVTESINILNEHDATTNSTLSFKVMQEIEHEKLIRQKNELSELFNETFVKVLELVDCENEVVVCGTKHQGLIRKYIDTLKTMSHTVNTLGILPTYQNLIPHEAETDDEQPVISHVNKMSHSPYHSSTSKSDMSFQQEGGSILFIKYLLIPALLGFLHLKIKDYDRLKLLKLACVYFKDSVDKCRHFNIVNIACEVAVKRDLCKNQESIQEAITKKQKEVMWDQMGKLKLVLDRIKRIHPRSTCTERDKSSHEAETEQSTPEGNPENSSLNPCIPIGEDIPHPSAARTFDEFVLYKYGREYLKGRLTLETREEEMRRSEENLMEKEVSNLKSHNDKTINHLQSHLEEKLAPQYEIKEEKLEKKLETHEERLLNEKNADELRQNIVDCSKSTEFEGDMFKEDILQDYMIYDNNPLSELLQCKQFIAMFAYKCLNQLEVCGIEIEILNSLQSGGCFRPHYLELFKSVTNLYQDDNQYLPVLMEV